MKNAILRFNTDQYLGFMWNNTHSSLYNTFITNNGEDLRFVNAPSFTNNYATPIYQNTNYFLGTTVENRTITLNLAAYRVTLKQYRELLNWMNIYNIGVLLLDYDKNYGYYVKLASMTDGVKSPLTKNNAGEMEYLVTFDVTFETVADFSAIARYRTMVPLTKVESNITQLLEIEDTIFEENGIAEVSIISQQIEVAGLEKYIEFTIINNGTLPIPIELDTSNFRGTTRLVQIDTDIPISDPTNEIETWLYLSVNIFEEEDVIGFNYSSDTGRVLVNDRLIESVQIQGNNLLLTKFAAVNKVVAPGKATSFRLYWTNNLEVALSFIKKTNVI